MTIVIRGANGALFFNPESIEIANPASSRPRLVLTSSEGRFHIAASGAKKSVIEAVVDRIYRCLRDNDVENLNCFCFDIGKMIKDVEEDENDETTCG